MYPRNAYSAPYVLHIAPKSRLASTRHSARATVQQTVKTFECLLSRHSTPRYATGPSGDSVSIPRDTVSRRTRYPARHGVLIQMDPPSQCDGRPRGWVLPCPLHPSPPRHHFRARPPPHTVAVATCCGRCANVELRQVASSRVESRRVALRCVSIALRCVA